MAITSIQNVGNFRGNNILFINTESSGNNREIEPNSIKNVGNCWIPWCTNSGSFPAHHVEIIDTASDNVLFYIWQQGNVINASSTGFDEPKPMDGRSDVGRSYNLVVNNDGVSANDS